MAASNSTIANNARDALNRILQRDASEMSEGDRRLRSLEIDRLTNIISTFEEKAQRDAGRRVFHPIRKINV